VKKSLAEAALNQEMISDAPACIFWSAIFERTTQFYGHRGRDRYVCMDLGHSAQNVYMQAEALRLGTCAIGAFDDDRVKKVMQLPAEEVPLYIMPIGKYYAE
ncbi:MAG: SagB/ThcOx family dehydrogenase, partial [candidate division WOR-3 bacterium]